MSDSSAAGRPCVLVTGGAGYIGSHACEALARAGYEPVAYDNLSKGFRELVKFGPFEEGDIRDRDRLLDVMRAHGPVAVMHFAALSSVGESVQEPALYYDNNVAGAICLLGAMRECGIGQLVFSSTAAVYGLPERQPITEAAATQPINPYGSTKLMIEQVLSDYAKAYGLRSVALRYFNACGAHPSAGIGEMHDPETHLIPRALMAVQGRIRQLDLMGDDYSTADGTAVRDYIHVCDLADAHLAALKYLEGGGETISLNLGTGAGFSVRQIVDAVGRATGTPAPVRMAPRRAGDPPELVADPGLARTVLGFEAKWTDIDAIIASAWRWAEAQHGAAPAAAS